MEDDHRREVWVSKEGPVLKEKPDQGKRGEWKECVSTKEQSGRKREVWI